MWIFLGLVSFVVFFCYGLWRKLSWAIGWPDDTGHLRTPNNQRYKFKDTTEKNVRTFYYAVPCTRGVSLRIHRESKWDRFAKKIGLSFEYQFNDPQFDDELYVVSNASAFQVELAETKALRDVVRLLFRDKRLKRIECHGQHVVARYQEKVESDAVVKPNTAEVHQIVGALYGLADSLDIAKSKCKSRWDIYELRAALLAALSTAILSLGVMELFRNIFIERAQIVLDMMDLMIFSTICATVVLFVLMTVTVVLLRGSSYAHVILAEVFISGGIGLILGGYVIARDINLSFDQSMQRMVQADIVSKRTWRGRKSGTHYELCLYGHDGIHKIPDKIEVSYSVYQMAQEGKVVTMAIRDGALGYRWVEGYYF
ncbi:MAG TPA: hypothetical protein VFP33_13460 [Gallionella sp.]|nr:hypothetical protein [Gallionella sp.]